MLNGLMFHWPRVQVWRLGRVVVPECSRIREIIQVDSDEWRIVCDYIDFQELTSKEEVDKTFRF